MFQILDRKLQYTSEWFELYTEKIQTDSGGIIDNYHVIEVPEETVSAVITNKNSHALLVKVPRYPVGTCNWEIPAGGAKSGESLHDAIVREVKEESGYTAVNVQHKMNYYPIPGRLNQKFHIFTGSIDENITPDFHDADEIVEVGFFTSNQIISMIKSQEITDGNTILALTIFLSEL